MLAVDLFCLRRSRAFCYLRDDVVVCANPASRQPGHGAGGDFSAFGKIDDHESGLRNATSNHRYVHTYTCLHTIKRIASKVWTRCGAPGRRGGDSEAPLIIYLVYSLSMLYRNPTSGQPPPTHVLAQPHKSYAKWTRKICLNPPHLPNGVRDDICSDFVYGWGWGGLITVLGGLAESSMLRCPNQVSLLAFYTPPRVSLLHLLTLDLPLPPTPDYAIRTNKRASPALC